MINSLFSSNDLIIVWGVFVPFILFIIRQYVIPKFTEKTSIMGEISLIFQTKNQSAHIPFGIKYIQLVNQTTSDFLFSTSVAPLFILFYSFYLILSGSPNLPTGSLVTLSIISLIIFIIFFMSGLLFLKVGRKIATVNNGIRSQQLTASIVFILFFFISPFWVVSYSILFYYLIIDKDTIHFFEGIQF